MESRTEAQLYGGHIRPTTLPADGPGMHASMPQSRPVFSGAGLSAIPRAPPAAAPSGPGPSPAKRARKDRGPNWLPQEIAALIAAKREMFIQDLDTVDGRDLITPETSKWIRVSHLVNTAGFSPILRDGPACKTKWNQIVPDYKRIADYLCKTGRNVPDYWELSPVQRKAEGLPRVFAQDVYESIHEWYGNRPMIQPPHVRDLLSPTDGNYRPPQPQVQQEHDGESEPETDDAMDFPPPEQVQVTEDSTPPRSPRLVSSTPPRAAGRSEGAGTPNSRSYNGLPPGITPQIISSSETSQSAVHRRPGNTGVRRKSISGHAVIAEATKATGAVMAQQMQDIADASRELERSKIEVQLKLFSEQMAYQREKDRRLYENAAIANDNERLSILKQGEMVSCLSHLSTLLSNSLTMNREFAFPTVPHAATAEHTRNANAFYAGGPYFRSAHTGGPTAHHSLNSTWPSSPSAYPSAPPEHSSGGSAQPNTVCTAAAEPLTRTTCEDAPAEPLGGSAELQSTAVESVAVPTACPACPLENTTESLLHSH